MSTIPYQKPALDIDAQLNLLEQRGMILEDRARAEHYLGFIGYYRLSGYWFPFQYRDDGPDHDNFRPRTKFDRVLDRYVFDRRLRLLIMDAAERIEVFRHAQPQDASTAPATATSSPLANNNVAPSVSHPAKVAAIFDCASATRASKIFCASPPDRPIPRSGHGFRQRCQRWRPTTPQHRSQEWPNGDHS
ncbi:Abi family protein [Pseudovibrio sp. SPO723]|uniref:Abi family protein n=1 Tax=Nesiotobacter zosterae TaxID=392721 RepID=UPI0029C1632F|nr:Abi family protein [Pseudovibrio sp. SPO723]MDX5595502.1 Abi family protein [Pseudovibrio sp. SPO723]